jgi:hypothetical protein
MTNTHTNDPITNDPITDNLTVISGDAASGIGCALERVNLAPVRQIFNQAGGVAGRIEVLGEPTAVPELFVIPVRNRDGRYRGSFSLTHAPSGFAVASDLDPCWFDNQRATLGELRQLAEQLAALHLDWAWAEPGIAPTDCLTTARATVQAWRLQTGRKDDQW